MAQLIHTKHRGDHVFSRTWVLSDGRHLGQLSGGGYAYLSGILVDKRQDLIDVIPSGPDQEKALAWWDNADQELEEKEYKKVLLDVDGEFKWEDGSPIESAQSLIENLPRGSNLDMLLAWFHNKEHEKTVAKEKAKKALAETTAKNVTATRKRAEKKDSVKRQRRKQRTA